MSGYNVHAFIEERANDEKSVVIDTDITAAKFNWFVRVVGRADCNIHDWGYRCLRYVGVYPVDKAKGSNLKYDRL